MDNKIAILFTNDAHCALHTTADSCGYAGVAEIASKLREEYGEGRVCLVDAGDSLGGGVYGLLSAGEVPLRILNVCGYDVYVPGNADFTFGMERLAMLEGLASFPFVCANFTNAQGAPFFKPYVIKELGNLRVAFIGAITPYTINVMNPERYLEGNKHGWNFCQDASGEKLYGAIQHAVDEARREGADFVVLVSHLGQSGQVARWRSDTVVGITEGIDLVLDGHSHERYIQHVSNVRGINVPVVQAGVSLSDIGAVVINEETRQVELNFVDGDDLGSCNRVADLVCDETMPLDQRLRSRVGECAFDLRAKTEDAPLWVIRSSETNLGDLVADALRVAMQADVALVPSWTIRDDLRAGAVSLGDICRVLPLGHTVASGMLTGQQILDALEYGARCWPNPCGSFLQVSGLAYAIDPTIQTTVVTDDEDSFLGVSGARRVCDVCIGGAPVDLAKSYFVAAPDFLLKYGSCGFSMMRSDSVAKDEAVPDTDALASFVSSFENAMIPDCYGSSRGQGRIATAASGCLTQ